MRFSLFAATDKVLSQPDGRVSGGEISVDCKGSFALGNALRGPVGVDLNAPQAQMR